MYWPSLAALALAAQAAPFTARDSVEMVRVADHSLGAAARQIERSPDGRHFAAVVYRGNLETGLNDYRLLLFTVDELRAALASGGQATAAGTVLAEAGTDRRWPESAAIDGLSWSSSDRLTFIRRGADRRAELFEVRLGGEGPRRLFEMPEGVDNIQTYDRSADGALAIFSAAVARPREDLSQRGFTLDPATDGVGAISGAPPPRDLAYFLADMRNGQVRRLPLTTTGWPTRASFSPSGRWALARVKLIPTERDLDYEEIGRTYARASPPGATAPDLAAVFTPLSYTRFVLIDTADGSTRTLIDAPGFAVGQFGQGALSQPIWVEGERAVIVGPTYLPLAGTARERARRRAAQSIALVRLGDGRAERLLDVPETVQYGGRYPRMTSLSSDGPDAVEIVFSGFEEAQVRRRIAFRSGVWREEPAAERPAPSGPPPLELRLGQTFERPPEIEVVDPATGGAAPLTRLNPQLAERSLGAAREVSWRDESGIGHTGLLVEPEPAQPGGRRAVVIQVGRYEPGQFLVDGGGGATGGGAARALAGRGIAVLQMPFRPRAAAPGMPQLSELDQFDRALSSAVVMLVDREGADPARIGLSGFSREGMRVEHAITFSRHRFAAAVVADSTAATPDAYALSYPMMGEWEQDWYIGAPFWGEGRARWYARSPLFNLERICTPLRIETFGSGSTSPQWSIYAILQRMGRPVEMFHIPYAGHLLTSPASRFAEQEALVDWFDFWLNGRESAGPAKRMQFERWRVLRERQGRSESACADGLAAASD